LSGRGLCDELITRPEESYRLYCVVVCDLETSRMGAPYIYDISHLRVNELLPLSFWTLCLPLQILWTTAILRYYLCLPGMDSTSKHTRICWMLRSTNWRNCLLRKPNCTGKRENKIQPSLLYDEAWKSTFLMLRLLILRLLLHVGMTQRYVQR